MLLYFLIFGLGALIYYLSNGFIIFIINKLTFRECLLQLFRKKTINSWLLISLCGGGMSVLSYLFYEDWYTTITVSGFILLITIITIIDIATMEIPNTFVIIAFVLGIISILTMPGTSLPSRILGMFVVSVPLLLITLLVPGAFGGGDIKLMAACGLFLGTKLTLLSFAFAVLTGGLYGIWLLVMKKKSGKEHFAFGPFLCLGMAAALFIGDRVWDWYAGLLYL